MRLKDRVAVITGGGRGIGKAIAEAFASEGASVVVAGTTVAKLEETAAAIKAKGGRAGAVQADVSNEKQVQHLMEEAVRQFGRIDILVNNSGIGGPTSMVVDLDLEEWNKVLGIDLTGSMLCSKHALKNMIPRKSGAIVNIGAEGGRAGDGRSGYPMRAPYCCAKMGVIGLTETLAVECGPYNIRVNAVSPAAVKGERLVNVFKGRAEASGVSFDELWSKLTANYSLGRVTEESDVAAAAVYLASDEARAVTGHTLVIHSGLHVNF
jgi:NAD(P)-dependent dehydrogenase (short-subunit alcohol dehydrogenase family)